MLKLNDFKKAAYHPARCFFYLIKGTVQGISAVFRNLNLEDTMQVQQGLYDNLISGAEAISLARVCIIVPI
jgi:hypothetical protein